MSAPNVVTTRAEAFEAATQCIDALASELVRRGRPRSASLVRMCISEVFLTVLRRGTTTRSERSAFRLPGFAREQRLPVPLVERLIRWVPATRKPEGSYLFLPVEPTHLQQALPVAAALEAGGARVVFATNRPLIAGRLIREGRIPIVPQHAWPNERRRALEVGVEAATTLPHLADLLERTSSAWVHADAIDQLMQRLLPSCSEALDACERLLRVVDPPAVVAGNDLTLEGRALVEAGRGRRTPSAVLMHGTSFDELQRAHTCDLLLAYGNAQRQQLVDAGIPPDHIRVCGAPYLDGTGASKSVGESLHRKLGIDSKTPLVLVAVSNPANMVSMQQHEATIRALLQASARIDGVCIVAKLHRADVPEIWHRLMATVPNHRLRIVVDRAWGWPSTILEWLPHVSLLVTGASTVAIEAMLFKVPVVSVDLCNEYAHIDFITRGATTHVTQASELIDVLAAFARGEPAVAAAQSHAQTYLDDFFATRDGNASSRCAMALEQLAAEHASRRLP